MLPSAVKSITSYLSGRAVRTRSAVAFVAVTLVLTTILSVVLPGRAALAQATPDLSGTWRGTLVAGQFDPLEIIFHISGNAGDLSARLDIPSQSRTGLPVDRVSIRGNNVTLQMPEIQAEYYAALVLADDGSSVVMLDGDWSQSGEHIPLRMQRDRP